MKIKQVNSFNYFTIKTLSTDLREWKLSCLVDLEEVDGKIEYKLCMPSIVCVYKDDSEQEEVFSADNEYWIVNTFYEYLKVKKYKEEFELNDSSFDELNVQTSEVLDIIELIELGIKIGMLNGSK